MRVVVYKEEDISTVLSALNRLQITGVEQAKYLATIGSILSYGKVKRYETQKSDSDEDEEK